MTLILSGTNGLSDVDGDASTPAVRGTDANSGIFFGADTVGVSTGGSEKVSVGASAVVVNDGGADVDFRVEGDTQANLLFVDASTDRVGIGTSSPAQRLHIETVTAAVGIRIGTGSGLEITHDNSGLTTGEIKQLYAATNAGAQFKITSGFTTFHTGTSGTERARITSGGALLVGKTSESDSTAGAELKSNGQIFAVRSGGDCLFANRLTDDGAIVNFGQDTVVEGSISVSGGTVSYNPFLGSHSGALADWSKPKIKIGTVMDTIDELLEYKVVVIDVEEEVPAKEAVLDEEGNEVEPAQEATTQTVQKRISYNGNGAVGSSATVEYEGQEYTGIIHNEREELLSFNKHLKVKVNDTAASKAVFGVFVGWNNDKNNDGGVYNDMLVGAVGNYVIRMAAGQEPQVGDLVEADGNGCAVVQDDDIIRTKTIAKVTSTIKQVTYDDGSFLVTCVLYCG